MKRCYKCGHVRPRDDFARNASRGDGLQNMCRECKRAVQRPKAHLRASGASKRRQLAYRKLWRYGVTPCQYTRMLIEQDGMCAICRAAPVANIDHCHETGRVRGLLCGPCNRGLGQFKDDVERLRSAVQYLAP